MLPDTYAVLRAKRLVSTDGQANALLAALAQNVVSKLDDVEDAALINDEMREALFDSAAPNGNWPGYSEDVVWELNDLVGELTRPEGAVYQALNNGYDHLTLGTARVKRLVTTAAGVSVVITKNGRFLTDDAMVAMAHRETPAIRQAERAWSRAQARIERDTQKIPALAQYAPGALTAAYGRMAPPQIGPGSTP